MALGRWVTQAQYTQMVTLSKSMSYKKIAKKLGLHPKTVEGRITGKHKRFKDQTRNRRMYRIMKQVYEIATEYNQPVEEIDDLLVLVIP